MPLESWYGLQVRRGRSRRQNDGSLRRVALILLVALLTSTATSQEGAQIEAEEDELGVAAFGVSAGFPAYQAYALNASVQYRFVGLAARASWTSAAGIYGSLALRGYPPIPESPVPVFVGAGFGSHAAGVAPFLAAGAHVPLTQHLRLDLEAGAARVSLLDDHAIVPYLSVGASYAIAFDASPALEGRREQREAEARERKIATGVDCGLEPDAATLGGAVSDTVRGFLRDARATYGSLYSDLQYSYEIEETEVDGERAFVRISYEGSAREIGSGKRISASGNASARYRWNGCSWGRTSISY